MWYQSNAVADFLIKIKTEESANIKKTNNLYLEKLGLVKSPILTLTKADKLLLNGKNVQNTFTVNELKVTKLLLRNKNEIVSIDQIADVLWRNNDDKFSPYAISKYIEGIRKKLNNLGIYQNLITTIKSQGYILQ